MAATLRAPFFKLALEDVALLTNDLMAPALPGAGDLQLDAPIASDGRTDRDSGAAVSAYCHESDPSSS